ncbi:kinetochore Sim4 complex subunit FTA2-domain-containing protein [Lasiosphaeria miniovina]|uniref:Kinetochore Sim4 complex subunit FTA2-domain-containing protein n=1 Tax=Lasiosphaeria miniovina TaxID=1954250 RepID=A0AA40DSD1_9PEZI|nr:kinetochore Sim4 complex subunit FTA2-domain-containing protein [Lasiosphaeria miniovina]KAK0713735.1 kinetochore Sim4 complex subunit FTA2-domain-containing protein [Lasiosphaeria miniovina]
MSQPRLPLPQVPGPKLAPFYNGQAEIEFLEPLGNAEEDYEGAVWKVQIKGATYALKMFKFREAEYLRDSGEGGYQQGQFQSLQHYVDFYDSFNCECRAYGRLKERGREDLAIPAQGYLLLTSRQEDLLGYGNDFWNRTAEYKNRDKHPIRAIVKDLATEMIPFREVQVGSLWRDAHELHQLGILNLIVKMDGTPGWDQKKVAMPQGLRDAGAYAESSGDSDPTAYNWREKMSDKERHTADEFYGRDYLMVPA